MSKLICPFCKTRLSPVWSPNPYWCPVEAFFYCRKCARKFGGRPSSCPHGGHHPQHWASALVVVGLIFSAGTAFPAVESYFDLSLRWELQSLPWSDLPLTNGTLVKVHGVVLGAPGTVVLDGWWRGGRAGYWQWSGTTFNLSLGTSTVLVDVSWMLANGEVFYAEHFPSDNERQYQSGDVITLVGQAGTPNGSVPFVASEVAPYPYNFLGSSSAYFDAGFFAGCVAGLSLLGAGLVQGIRWTRLERVRWGQTGPRFEPTQPPGRSAPERTLAIPVPVNEQRTLWVRLPASRGRPPRYLDRTGSILWISGVALFASWFALTFALQNGWVATPAPVEWFLIIILLLVGGMALQLLGARSKHSVRAVQCESCSTWNRPYATLCRSCGDPLFRPKGPAGAPLPSSSSVCSRCGKAVNPEFSVCPYCATVLR